MLHLYSHHIHVTFRIPLIHYPLFVSLNVCIESVMCFLSFFSLRVYVPRCVCVYVWVCVCVCVCGYAYLMSEKCYLVSTQTTSTALCIVYKSIARRWIRGISVEFGIIFSHLRIRIYAQYIEREKYESSRTCATYIIDYVLNLPVTM